MATSEAARVSNLALMPWNSSHFITKIIGSLSIRFSIKDLDYFYYFLGVEIIPNCHGLFLSQHKYIHDLLTRFNLDGLKESMILTSSSTCLLLLDGTPATDATCYRNLIGVMQYLSLFQPDIAYIVNKRSMGQSPGKMGQQWAEKMPKSSYRGNTCNGKVAEALRLSTAILNIFGSAAIQSH
ncbi:hypothetical protein CsSME_00031837 [Camellia sinensis var. sinensis]